MAAFSDRELRKFVTPEVVWGPGARHLVGRYALNIGASKVLLVTDAGVETAGWSAEVAASLARSGVSSTVFRHVTPNPRRRTMSDDIFDHLAEVLPADVINPPPGGSLETENQPPANNSETPPAQDAAGAAQLVGAEGEEGARRREHGHPAGQGERALAAPERLRSEVHRNQ